MELLVIPGLLFLAWRPGPRRILVVAAGLLYFAFRMWSYLVFVGARLDFARLEHSHAVLSSTEVAEAHPLLVDDQRWMLVLAIMGLLLLAAHFPATRQLTRDRVRP